MRTAKLLHLPLFFVAMLFSLGAMAQEPSVTTETYGTWTYRCSQVAKPADNETAAKKACELVQVVRDGKGNVIAQIAFGKSPEDEGTLISVIQVPQGTLLIEPVLLSDEAKENTLSVPYFSCFNTICLARSNVSQDLLSALGAGNKGSLEFADRNGRKVRVLLSFDGLKAASERLISTSG